MKRLHHSIQILTLIVISGTALSTQPMETVEFDLLTSDDCGYLTAEVPDTGPDRRSLVLRFREFGVTTALSPYVERRCKLDVYVTVPKGMQFRPIAAFADGEVATSERGNAYISLSYAWKKSSVSSEKWFAGNALDTFLADVKPPREWSFSPCGNRDSVHWVGGSFFISAYRDQSDANDSDIALFNAEHQNKLTSRWIWEWQPCTTKRMGL